MRIWIGRAGLRTRRVTKCRGSWAHRDIFNKPRSVRTPTLPYSNANLDWEGGSPYPPRYEMSSKLGLPGRFQQLAVGEDTDPPTQQRESGSGGRVSVPAALRNVEEVGLTEISSISRGRRLRRPSRTTTRIMMGRAGLRTRRVAKCRGSWAHRDIFNKPRSASPSTLLGHIQTRHRLRDEERCEEKQE